MYTGVASPAARELERLRAERDALLAELGQREKARDAHETAAQRAAAQASGPRPMNHLKPSPGIGPTAQQPPTSPRRSR
jgi:hypothetical protein